MSSRVLLLTSGGARASRRSRAGVLSINRQNSMMSGAAPSGAQQPAVLDRRALLATIASAPLATIIATPADALPFFGQKGPKLPPNVVRDETLAYTFTYPSKTSDGKDIPVTASRKPEKYSSAAPLTADARQRIVAEFVSLANGITMTVFVGPATGALKATDPAQWKPKDVATAVLTDRSASRNTQGQRIPLATIESVAGVQKNGSTYYVYETLQQGSPNLYDTSRDTYRVGLCVTGVRAGLDGTPYFYTLSMSAPSKAWPKLEGGFKDTAESFTLLEPGKGYVPPDKDPWLFF